MKLKMLRNKATFQKIILSYISILIIPLVLGIVLYVSAIAMYIQDVHDANMQVLLNVKDSVNINLSGMSNLTQALLCENDIIKLSGKTSYKNTDYVLMSSVQKKLSMSIMSNDYIDDILIYFNKADFLLTSKEYLNSPHKMQGYSEIIGMSIVGFTDQLSRDNFYSLRILDESRGKKSFFITSDETNLFSILIKIKNDALKKLLVSEESHTFILDKNNNYLSFTENDGIRQENASWFLPGETEKNSVIETEDETYQIKYVRFIPQKLYYKNLFILTVIAFFFIGACLVLGLPVAFYIAKVSYNPVKQILSLIPQTSSEAEKDDYKVISNSIKGLLQRNKDNQIEKDERSISMRNYLFYRLVEGHIMTREALSTECSKLHIDFPYDAYAMLHFYVENGSNLFFEKDENANDGMAKVLFIAVKNLMAEILPGDYKFFIAEYKTSYYSVININKRLDKTVAVGEIKKYCEQLIYQLEKDFRVMVSISVSGLHDNAAEIYRCYNEAMTVFQNQQQQKRSMYVVQYEEIMEPADEIGVHRPARTGKTRTGGYNPESTIARICRYVDESYSDPTLTVSSMAQKFDMTVANLSAYFKRKTGSSPLEYIQNKRIAEAKRLIIETDMKISEVAKAVGYYDTRPLIRSFKRVEGYTPTEYRDANRKQ